MAPWMGVHMWVQDNCLSSLGDVIIESQRQREPMPKQGNIDGIKKEKRQL
jgi:hypothetical protein